MAKWIKHGFFFSPVSLLILMFVLSGCGMMGSASTTSTGSTTQSTTSAAPTKDTSNDYGKSATSTTPTPAPTTDTSSTTGVVVKTASAMVKGKSLTILTDAKGFTLYYFTPDTSAKTACLADCAAAWPPLLNTGTSDPQAATKLPASLEVYPNANGKQIVYNDHPLYTFTGDSAPGQTNGEGLAGKWFVVTPDLAKNA